MTWLIPAKTFLIGEYAAVQGAPAILLTTSPCFTVALSNEPGLYGIHPESPAGRWWIAQKISHFGLQWHDPYDSRGGLGASSAQFIGAYLASSEIKKKTVHQDNMMDTYFQLSWQGKGIRPSGYDVLAQLSHGCVFIENNQTKSHQWPFHDLAFVLLHTGKKLATHQHLQQLNLSGEVQSLITTIESAQLAFNKADSSRLIDAINTYHDQLMQMSLVAETTLNYIEMLQKHDDILAMKGCGAMGSDILLLLTPLSRLEALLIYLSTTELKVIATNKMLYLPQNNFAHQ